MEETGHPTLKIRFGTANATGSGGAPHVEAFPPFPYTYEEQFIIRFPPLVASELREELREAEQPEDLAITFTDARRATIQFHGRRYVGILLDLPTILETHKTFDRTQYYKIADICQMLLVLPEGGETPQKLAEYEANGWQYADGMAPPLKNVRTRRFRHPTASSGRQKDVEAIEKRVQVLLDRDTQAISSSFTVYDSMGRAVLTGGGDGMDGKFVKIKPDEEGDGDDVASVSALADGSASSGDEEFAAELEEQMLMAEDDHEHDPEVIVSETADSTETSLGQVKTAPMPTPSPAVIELQAKINERKAQLASVSNPLIKARLEDVIRQLEQDLQSRIK